MPIPKTRLLVRSALLVTACLPYSGCDQPSPPALEVGPLTFTESELLGLSPTRRALLGNVAALAIAHGADSTEALLRPLEDAIGRRDLAERLFAELVVEANAVSRAELRERYLVDPELELEVRHIIYLAGRRLPSDVRAEAERQARAALERARAGEPFSELAAELSEEPGAAPREGLLQPGREGAWVDEFWAAAKALEVGEVSDVVETQYGYHVLKLEGKRIVPFAEARDGAVMKVAAALPADSAEAWVARLASAIELVDDGASDDRSDTTVLARWNDDAFTVAHFETFLAARPLLEGGAPARPTDASGRRNLILEASRIHFMAAEAERRALGTPTPPDQARLVLETQQKLLQWVDALALSGAGGDPELLKATALAGLGRTGQSAEIARNEMNAVSRLFQATYPVRTPSPAP